MPSNIVEISDDWTRVALNPAERDRDRGRVDEFLFLDEMWGVVFPTNLDELLDWSKDIDAPMILRLSTKLDEEARSYESPFPCEGPWRSLPAARKRGTTCWSWCTFWVSLDRKRIYDVRTQASSTPVVYDRSTMYIHTYIHTWYIWYISTVYLPTYVHTYKQLLVWNFCCYIEG